MAAEGTRQSQRKSSLSAGNSKSTSVSKSSRDTKLVRLSVIEIQQAREKEKEVYKLFVGHANILELLNVYDNLKNSKVSPIIMSGWMWHSWRGEIGEKGYPEGEGRAFLGANVYYTGSFKNGLLHGKGSLKWGGDSAYEGTFFYNCLFGSGEYSWGCRGTYTGKVFDGFPHKEGIMQEGKLGHVYDGSFVHGLREGLGKMVYKEGSDVPNYTGDWAHDQKHGQGRYLYQFATYQGEWKNGKRGGIGIQTQIVDNKKFNPLHKPIFAASVYEGNWVNGLPHGRGKHIWTWEHNKETLGLLHNAYVGEFDNGTRSKKGTFYYASGAIYQGFWKKNFKDGHGLYTYEDGRLNKVLCTKDHFHFHDDRSVIPLIKHALDSVMQEDIDVESLKLKLLYLTLRFTNTFRSIFHNYSAYSTYSSKFTTTMEKKQFNSTIEDIKYDDELITDGATSMESKLLAEIVESPAKVVEPLAEGAESTRSVVEKPKEAESTTNFKNGLKKYRLSKTNFSIKQDFKDEISKSYLKFIVKYVHDGEKRDTLFGDALGTTDDNLYYIHKNLRLEGQAYAMTVDNFWRLCYDAHIVEPGLGLAQIDAIIYPPSNAWDDAFDLYCPKRQLIHREVIENLVKIGLCKYFGFGMQVDQKLQDFFEHCFNKIENKDDDSIYKFIMEQSTQDVLLQFKQNFRKLFSKFLLKCKTQAFCIKLEHVIFLFMNVIYEGVTQDSIISVISHTLYQTEYQSKDPQLYLELEINFKEFEIILVKFGMLGFAPYKQFEDGNAMKEHGQSIQRFMDEISVLNPRHEEPAEDEEAQAELVDEEAQEVQEARS